MPNSDDEKGKGGAGGTGGETPKPFKTWEALVAAHPEAQSFYDVKTAGQQSALETERKNAGDLEKKLRTLSETSVDEKTAKQLRDQADTMKTENERLTAENKAATDKLAFNNSFTALGGRGDAADKAWTYAQAAGLDANALKKDPDFGKTFFAAPAAPARANAGAGAADAGGGSEVSKTMQFSQKLRGQTGIGVVTLDE